MPNDQKTDVHFRPFPISIKELGLPQIFLANLTLKHAFFNEVFAITDLVELLKISSNIINHLLEYLAQEKYVQILGSERPILSDLNLSMRYSLTNAGKKRAEQLLEYDSYVGPVPVTLKEYSDQVSRQPIDFTAVTSDRLKQILEDLVIPPEMVEDLGVAAINARSLFLYGPTGNGKTSIAMRLGKIWEDVILVPYAIFVSGSVIRLFDDMTHKPVQEMPPDDLEKSDTRWIPCHRPVVVAGGELTLEMLDLIFNPALNYYEAPLQLKANNGVFIVDDFGRQHIAAHDLLNRWIIPLEERHDHLRLRTGQKFTIPFEQFIIFATNLEPHALVDEAFLRRISSKVKVDYVTSERFMEILRRLCESFEIKFEPESAEYLITKHYADHRRMSACHPRDLVQQVLNYSRFHHIKPTLSRENLDRAVQKYFL